MTSLTLQPLRNTTSCLQPSEIAHLSSTPQKFSLICHIPPLKYLLMTLFFCYPFRNFVIFGTPLRNFLQYAIYPSEIPMDDIIFCYPFRNFVIFGTPLRNFLQYAIYPSEIPMDDIIFCYLFRNFVIFSTPLRILKTICPQEAFYFFGYTSNSVKADIDNSQMCNMRDKKVMGIIEILHGNVKDITSNTVVVIPQGH